MSLSLSASNPDDTLGRTREEDLCNESYKISARSRACAVYERPLVLIQRRSRSDNRSEPGYVRGKSFIFAGNYTARPRKTAAIMEIAGKGEIRKGIKGEGGV